MQLQELLEYICLTGRFIESHEIKQQELFVVSTVSHGCREGTERDLALKY